VRGIGAREVELERVLADVKEENAALRADNEDLNNVLMEYASTLEKVLDGLRVYAVGSPLHCLYPDGWIGANVCMWVDSMSIQSQR